MDNNSILSILSLHEHDDDGGDDDDDDGDDNDEYSSGDERSSRSAPTNHEDDDEDGGDDDNDDDNDANNANEECTSGASTAFDIRLPVSHLYLRSSELGEVSSQPLHEDAGARLVVPLLLMEAVLLPGQILPLNFTEFKCVNFIRQTARKHTYFCLLTNGRYLHEEFFEPGLTPLTSKVATLFEVKNIGADDERLTVQAVGRQRCRLASQPRARDLFHADYAVTLYVAADVIVLEDTSLASTFCHMPDSSLNRLPAGKRQNWHSFTSHHSAFAIAQFSTATVIKWLKSWLQKWFELSRIDVIIDQGTTVFSYWVASNLPVDLGTKLTLLEESCTERRLRMEWRIASQIRSLVCSKCGEVKCEVDDLLNLSVESNAMHFVNTHGYLHEIFTASRISNVALRGRPSTEFSWFPGYAWTIMNCGGCHEHIGWRFTSANLLPKKFFGITRKTLRLVKREESADLT